MSKDYGKLVRDNIPNIIKENGEIPNIEVLSNDRYLKELDRKLFEEMIEYEDSKELEEIADILEVLEAIVYARGYKFEDVLKIKEDKKFKRGGFNEKIFLVSTSKEGEV